jgi:hypothetical protein
MEQLWRESQEEAFLSDYLPLLDLATGYLFNSFIKMPIKNISPVIDVESTFVFMTMRGIRKNLKVSF